VVNQVHAKENCSRTAYVVNQVHANVVNDVHAQQTGTQARSNAALWPFSSLVSASLSTASCVNELVPCETCASDEPCPHSLGAAGGSGGAGGGGGSARRSLDGAGTGCEGADRRSLDVASSAALGRHPIGEGR
jgi:hypothetical protein